MCSMQKSMKVGNFKVEKRSPLIGDFSTSWLGQCPGICKQRFFDCRKPGWLLPRTGHNPGRNLVETWQRTVTRGAVGSIPTSQAETRQKKSKLKASPDRTLVGGNPTKPGLTEPGANRDSGTRRNPAEPGTTRQNLAEPGGIRRNPGPLGSAFRTAPGFWQVRANVSVKPTPFST